MTKEMTAGRRIDILTDALLHYARHRLNQFGRYNYLQYPKKDFKHINIYLVIGPSLLLKMDKSKKLMENAMAQLQEIFSDLHGSYSLTKDVL